MNGLDIFQYLFMGIVCIGGIIGMIFIIINEKKK